ncbi:uncharacterized protein LOC142663510 isoform X1 [Rhinoderma darwinii]|uniref:uncharacterized protein LOC142663510 isoform X1 n=1 Tax=Rhinoderma darwinii TaxID=43563 RepID=UPI003F6696E9
MTKIHRFPVYSIRIFSTNKKSPNMDKNRHNLAQQVLNLTLEIVVLLTGEDYVVVKKSRGRGTNVVDGTRGEVTDVHISSPPSLAHEPHKKKILELNHKMVELLTGEVPIRCQDVAIYFSMEEWEYIEGHKDIYKDVMMEDHRNRTPSGKRDLYKDVMMEDHRPLTSPGLPKDGTKENPPMRLKEERYGGNLTNADVYTPTDHKPQNPPTLIKEEPVSCHMVDPDNYIPTDDTQQDLSTPLNEEPVSCDGGTLTDPTKQYLFIHIKEELTSCNGGTSTEPNIYTATDLHTRQYPSTYIKDEPSSCGGGHLEEPKYTSLDHTQQYQQKEAPGLEDGGTFTEFNVYTIKEHAPQYTSPHVELSSCGEGSVVRNSQQYPSAHVKEGTNLPETQGRAHESISIQFSCSECRICFLSMTELVSHQGIHIAEKLLHSGTHVFTTAIVHTPQVPPVKYKLLNCPKCERTFYTKSSLVGHMKTHWGEINYLKNETYKCDQSGKCFPSNFPFKSPHRR